MKKKMLLAGGLFLTIAAPGVGFALLAPHNESTYGISCFDCHNLNEWPGTPGVVQKDYFLKDCSRCHTNTAGSGYSKKSAPVVKTHSSVTTGSRFDNWSFDCGACHGHRLMDTPVAEGLFTSKTVNGDRTELAVDLAGVTIYDSSFNDIAKWGAKSGADRGLLLSVKYWDQDLGTFVNNSFEVASVGTDTITVKGVLQDLPDGTPPDGSFEVHYGQFIRDLIQGSLPNDFSGPSSFANDESGTQTDPTPTGVCQVCHTKTNHWRSDGTLADHYNGERCTQCHDHKKGFPPSCDVCHGNPPLTAGGGGPDGLVNRLPDYPSSGATTPGKHQIHTVDYQFACQECHFDGMPRTPIAKNYKFQMGFQKTYPNNYGQASAYFGRTLSSPYSYEGTNGATITIDESMTCKNVYCHSQGKTPAQGFDNISSSPGWAGNSPDRQGDNSTCNNCHGYPPGFDPHKLHVSRGLTCANCHWDTTQTNNSIADRTRHVNGAYDVAAGGTFRTYDSLGNPVNNQLYRWEEDPTKSFEYIYMPNGGTCGNNYCHLVYGFPQGIPGRLPAKWKTRPQILQASFSFTGPTSCPKDATSGTATVNVTPNCPECDAPYVCDFDWGDGTTSKNVPCSNSHSYVDKVPVDKETDPTKGVIGQWPVTWTIRDVFNTTLATGTATNAVGVCSVANVPVVAARTIANTSSDVPYEVELVDQSYDPDYDKNQHYDPTGIMPGRIKIEWGCFAPGATTKGITEEDIILTDQPSNKRFTFQCSRSGYAAINHCIKDNDASSQYTCTKQTFYISR